MDTPALTALAVAGAAAGAALVCSLARRRTADPHLMQALATAAERLAATPDGAAAIPAALAAFGNALACTRLDYEELAGGIAADSLRSTRRHAWVAPGVGDTAPPDRPWHPDRSRWFAELAAGRCLVAPAADLPPHERALLAADGLAGLILAPVVVAGRLHGLVSLADASVRRRGQAEVAAVRTLAALIGGALERARLAAELAASTAKAEAGDRAKREFLANISHEVRTPLNGVLGMAGLLLDSELSAAQRELALVVRSSAENLHTLLNDLIDLAQSEGEQRAERTRFDPLRLAEDVVAMLAERAHAKGVEIAVAAAPALPRRLLGDRSRLGQVLVNLVGNAIKFTIRGHVLVQLDWLGGESDGELTVTVEDTGIGIGAEAQSHLFAPFFQGDGSSTRRHGGTGLGLAICARHVAVMGGRITCSSSLGQGATFRVCLPTAQGSTGHSVRTVMVSRQARGATTLVIEPCQAVRRAIVGTCRRLGLVTEEASSCAEALERLATVGAETPRLVLVAANIPGAGDLPAAAAGRGSNAAFILLAPVSRRPGGAESRRLGFAACLVKPPRTARLAEAVTRALDTAIEEESRDATREHRHIMRVLVVEDDTVNQQLMKAVLEPEGFRVDVANDGHEALEALARADYAVVLMDLLMPVMDGLTCTREIRRLERERGAAPIPIIAVSAADDRSVEQRCREAGMDGHVRKPFEPRAMRRLLRRLAPGRRNVIGE